MYDIRDSRRILKTKWQENRCTRLQSSRINNQPEYFENPKKICSKWRSPEAGAVALFHHVTDVRCLIGTKVGNELSVPWKVDIRPVTLTTLRRSLDFLTFLHSKFGAGIK